MKTAYCTHCQKVTVMKITITELPVSDCEGKVKQTAIENYHCLSCGLFILRTIDSRRLCKQNKHGPIEPSRI